VKGAENLTNFMDQNLQVINIVSAKQYVTRVLWKKRYHSSFLKKFPALNQVNAIYCPFSKHHTIKKREFFPSRTQQYDIGILLS